MNAHSLPYRYPVLLPLLLTLAALLFRVADIFWLRLDERWGETLLAKSLGFLLVLGCVWARRGWTGALPSDSCWSPGT